MFVANQFSKAILTLLPPAALADDDSLELARAGWLVDRSFGDAAPKDSGILRQTEIGGIATSSAGSGGKGLPILLSMILSK